MEIKKLDDDLWIFRVEHSTWLSYTYFLRYEDKIYYPSLTREACRLVFDLHKRVKTKFKDYILDKYCRGESLTIEIIEKLKSSGIYLNTEEILGWK